MFRILNKRLINHTILRLSGGIVIPFLNTSNSNDYDMLNSTPKEKPTTGWDNIKQMFTKNEYEEFSLELHNVVQASLCGVFFGVCYGGFIKSRQAYIYFIENNQATIFNSTFEAKRKLQDCVTIAFAKGACRWGWRLGLFTGLYSLIATTISVYRDKNSVIEYVVAGAVTGSLYKANLGLAACLVGAGLGAVLSLAGGLIIVGILNVSGVSMADIRKSLYAVGVIREEYYNQAIDDRAEEKHDNLTRHHDDLVQAKGSVKVDQLT